MHQLVSEMLNVHKGVHKDASFTRDSCLERGAYIWGTRYLRRAALYIELPLLDHYYRLSSLNPEPSANSIYTKFGIQTMNAN